MILRLAKGNVIVQGRRSEAALYNEDLASFDSKTFNQAESIGNVKTHGMQSKLFWQLRQQGKIAGAAETGLPMLPTGPDK